MENAVTECARSPTLVHIEVASGAERDLSAAYAFRVFSIETKA
jgi:hypothetical protein